MHVTDIIYMELNATKSRFYTLLFIAAEEYNGNIQFFNKVTVENKSMML